MRGLSPTGVTATAVDLAIVGLGSIEDLPVWVAQYGARASELPLSATGLGLAWRPEASEPEAFALRDASLKTAKTAPVRAKTGELLSFAGVLEGARVLVATKELTRTDVAWSLSATGMSVGLGAREVRSAPVRAELHARPSPVASVEIEAAPLSSLAPLLGLDVGASAITLAGKIELRVPGGASGATAAEGPLDGTFALTLKGFVLPHPRELDGLLFGDSTVVNAEARVSADRQRITLTRVDLATGALKLTGSGAIQREGTDASLGMDLSGSIPCSQLAGSAVVAHLPGLVGVLAESVARRTLSGSVAVRVHVDARASRLTAAHVEPRAIVRCSAHF